MTYINVVSASRSGRNLSEPMDRAVVETVSKSVDPVSVESLS